MVGVTLSRRVGVLAHLLPASASDGTPLWGHARQSDTPSHAQADLAISRGCEAPLGRKRSLALSAGGDVLPRRGHGHDAMPENTSEGRRLTVRFMMWNDLASIVAGSVLNVERFESEAEKLSG